MLHREHIDELICQLASWDRDTLTREFIQYSSVFPVDCTPAFLSTLSDDRLRHVFLAVCLQNKKLPESAMATQV